jgi:hypothetical protein
VPSPATSPSKATKATETTGHTSRRLTPASVTRYARTHVCRLIAATWRLGTPPADLDEHSREEWDAGYGRLRPWAHILGFGGHFSTKSRRYSTTLGALRQARRDWRRGRLHEAGPDRDERQDRDIDGEERPLSSSGHWPSPASAGTPPPTRCWPTPPLRTPTSNGAPPARN